MLPILISSVQKLIMILEADFSYSAIALNPKFKQVLSTSEPFWFSFLLLFDE